MTEIHDLGAVAIDGEVIRRIREEKRLTQLYVSKVVGVTTDTVSRWENNRYPTIRKDNALKLAEALEVDYDVILLKPDEGPDDLAVDVARDIVSKKNIRIFMAGVFFLVVAVSLPFLYQAFFSPVKIVTERTLPVFAAPGGQVFVHVGIECEEEMKIILKEKIPPGWDYVAGHPHGSKIDRKDGIVRWIFKHSPTRKNIYYLLSVAADAKLDETVTISGSLVANYDGRQTQVDVPSGKPIRIAPYHWADRDGNNIIDDMEILAVSDYAEDAGDELVGWDHLEKLWEAGRYRWDKDTARFVPESIN